MPSPDITCHLYTPASPRSPPALRPTTLPPALPPSACAQHPHIHALTSAVDVVDAAATGVSDAGRCARTCTRTWREWGEREVVASGRGGCEREVEVEGEGRDECFLGGRERGPQRRRKGERNDVGVDSSVGSSVGGGNGGKEVGRELAGKDTAVDRRGRDGHGRRWGFRRPWGGCLAVSAGGGGAGAIGGAPTTR